MPPLNIQKDLPKQQSIEMNAEYLRENLSQQQLVQHSIPEHISSSGTSTPSSADSNPAPAQPLTRKQIVAVTILCFVNLINYMDRYTVAGLLDDIGTSFNVDNSYLGLLQTAFIFVYMVFAPLYGYLGDRYNRKVLMAVGVFLWSLTTLIGSFMESYGWFLAMRCFVGIGEASYSTIAPTLISDMFVGNVRSKMLALFYFAIPVGSGLGYIIGSEVRDLADEFLPGEDHPDAWRWGLRVTPVMGLIAVILVLFALQEPPRGESEGGQHLSTSSFLSDLKYLFTNNSYVLCTIAFTCVTYVAGALAWWGPIYVQYGVEIQEHPSVKKDNVAFVFGAIAMIAGLIGVPFGSIVGQRLRGRYPSADPLVCGAGMLVSAPLLMTGMLLAGVSTIWAFVVVFFGQLFLNLNWAVVSDIVLYIVIPTRRSSAEAFQILLSHAFGDAGSPYVVGVVSDVFKPLINSSTTHFNSTDFITTFETDTPDDEYSTYVKYKSLQYSLIICTIVELFGALFFFWNAYYIKRDKENCDRIIAEEEKKERELERRGKISTITSKINEEMKMTEIGYIPFEGYNPLKTHGAPIITRL